LDLCRQSGDEGMASPGFGLYVEPFGGLQKERIEREGGSRNGPVREGAKRGRKVLRVDEHEGGRCGT